MSDGIAPPCELCTRPGGALLWQGRDCRVVAVDDPHYPGFCRVVCNEHVREMTDLDEARRSRIMNVVFAVEAVVRELYSPDKINLASFGNMVPHVHWHVIPRWRDDRHFPEPVWGSVHNEAVVARPTVGREKLTAALAMALKEMG